MSGPRKSLTTLVATLAALMVAIDVYSAVMRLSDYYLTAIAGAEIVVMALLVFPWFIVFARRASVRFSSSEAGSAAWGALSWASLLLVAGQVVGYLPATLELGRAEPVAIIVGQLMPAVFRIVLCWSLWRMRRAYRETGLDFRMQNVDVMLSIFVAVVAAGLILRTDILFAYWSANSSFSPLARQIMTVAQIFNFVLYPAVFYFSLSMVRYSSQMGGGLVARAWGAVALYGLLQPLHVFVIAVGYERAGPMLSLGLDNFIVLSAFAALAFGPIFQMEASETRSQD